MKKSVTILLSLLLSVSFSAYAQKNPKDNFEKKPLSSFKIPEVKKVTLKNGMRLFLIEDRRYPTIDIRGMVRTGSVFDPAGKAGLASITGTVLRTGGTQKQSGDQIDRELEQTGSSVETEIDLDSGNISVSTLSEHFDRVFAIFADVLQNPLFAEDKIGLAKIEEITAISRRNENARDIAAREFKSIIYGADSPYTKKTEYSTINSVTRNDVAAFYKKYFVPENVIFTIWGDFNSKDMIKKFEKAFGSWKNSGSKPPVFPSVSYDYKKSVSLIEKSDVNQSDILIGHIGGKRDNPDYATLSVMNSILSFERLFKKVRTDEGLAYSVWGNYGAGYIIPGVFSMGAQTKTGSTVKAINLICEELIRVTKEEVGDDELTKAKEQILNSYVFEFDNRSKLARRMLVYAYYGYPLDFAEKFFTQIASVTKADILKAAKKYLKPDMLHILVVGNKNEFDKPLSVFGEVKAIDISIPEPAK